MCSLKLFFIFECSLPRSCFIFINGKIYTFSYYYWNERRKFLKMVSWYSRALTKTCYSGPLVTNTEIINIGWVIEWNRPEFNSQFLPLLALWKSFSLREPVLLNLQKRYIPPGLCNYCITIRLSKIKWENSVEWPTTHVFSLSFVVPMCWLLKMFGTE